MKSILERLYPANVGANSEIATKTGEFLLLTLAGLKDTEFCLDEKLEPEMQNHWWNNKSTYDSRKIQTTLPFIRKN